MTETEFKSRFLKARKTLIARDFSKLNDMQRQAVLATEGPLLLLAGAGSGKTTVLINRIANLLRYGRASDSEALPPNADEAALALLEGAAADQSFSEMEQAWRLAALEPCEPWRIIAITFTNKAAEELKTRLASMLGPDAQDIWAQTFHSACVRILRRHADRLGYPGSFTIYDTADSVSVLKHIIRDLNIDEKTFPPKTLLGYVSRAKDDLLTPALFLARAEAAGDIRRQKIGEVYAAYAKRLKEAGAMDFDDLIYNTVLLLENFEDVRAHYQRRFKYVLIDEYQDTNKLQYRLAAALAGENGNICVVGDDDQSIYKFRGATIENILSFEAQFKNARVIRLEQNYRSTGNILGAANAVIRNNTARKDKALWTDKRPGDKLTLYIAQNESDEAQYVAGQLMKSFSDGESWRDSAVLYRMNAQTNRLEYAFKRSGIPYRIIGGTRFFDRLEIKDLLSYLWVILNPEDDYRLLRIINSPPRGIGDKTIETAQAIAAAEGQPLFAVIKNADRYQELARSAVRLREFAKLVDELRALAERLPLDALYDEVVDKSGYVRALEQKPSDENNARIENIGELKSNIIAYIRETGDSQLAGFLDEVALYTDIDNFDAGSSSVVMMTMHSAKGLEFDDVYIVGVEEGIFPGIRCIGEPEEMEEERRLCYVGITRARKKLTLICARQRMLFGRTNANSPSRFVEEIPEEFIERTASPANDAFSPGGLRAGYGPYSGTAGRTGAAEKQKPNYLGQKPQDAPAAADYRVGDEIVHTAFGEGEIVAMTPMGGDYFIEIRFGEQNRKFMLRAAAVYMRKNDRKG
ncbi:MAG: UvrD-helicase domain-containing protein [Oscillospiraceae bacterium]|nr:UvrD-helicase domain-containing protein [Oscillospiraceae bacterium]